MIHMMTDKSYAYSWIQPVVCIYVYNLPTGGTETVAEGPTAPWDMGQELNIVSTLVDFVNDKLLL
jgi:hypothetical protein